MLVLVIGIALALILTLRASGTGKSTPSSAEASTQPRATATVERADLRVTAEAAGVVEFTDTREIRAGREGTITWLPTVGTTLVRGDAVLRVDDRPVPIFVGETPLYRPLDGSGLTGPDVQVVADNLVTLGYLGSFPQGDITGPQFAGALSDWRTAQGLDPVSIEANSPTPSPLGGDLQPKDDADGTQETEPLSVPPSTFAPAATSTMLTQMAIEPGDVLVLPSEVRVSAILAQLGDEASEAPVLRVSSTRKHVRVQVDASTKAPLTAGGLVTVVTPDGSETPGTVSSVGTALEDGSTEVIVDVPDQLALGAVESGPVTVRVDLDHRDQVLVVPVAALLALREGGYALQLEDGSLVGVETGLFTQELVEVSGEGIGEGMTVVSAA